MGGSIRRVNTEIRREKERKEQLDDHFGEDGDKRREAKVMTTTLKDLKCTVIRCNNAHNQQYEVKLTVSAADEAKLKLFYKSEKKEYKKRENHYVYIQRQGLTTVAEPSKVSPSTPVMKKSQRRLASDARRRQPEN